MSTEEPIGVMKCWECIEKHARDMEHHLEDIVRAMKGDKERIKFEDWIDYVRNIRRYAHSQARDIAIEPIELPKVKETMPHYWEAPPYEEKQSEEVTETPLPEDVEFSEPLRRERGKEVYVDVFHEKEECAPSSFRAIKPNPEHILTVCCPEAPVGGRCPVAMMAQKLEHLHPEGEGSCPVCGGA